MAMLQFISRLAITDTGIDWQAVWMPELKQYKWRWELSEMTRGKFQAYMHQIFEDCKEISRAKNADYAQTDDPFANFRQVEHLGLCSVAEGILVRLSDKFTRISNLLNREAQVKDEAIGDTIKDAINYLAILGAWLEIPVTNDNFEKMTADFSESLKFCSVDCVPADRIITRNKSDKKEVAASYMRDIVGDVSHEEMCFFKPPYIFNP